MKTLQITGYGDIASNLAFNETKKPSISDNQVLIEVHAAGVNPVDYKIIEGVMKKVRKLSFPAPLGYDVAGVVVEKGKGVRHLKIGDEVYSRIPSEAPGSFAEFVAVNADVVSLKPSNIDFTEAAGLPLTGLTTMQSFEKANLKTGDKILIHAGSGGIGTFAIQYAKSLGATVYTTTSTNNVEWVKKLGADKVIDYKTENYLEIAKNMDVVYDTLGGTYTEESFKTIKQGGKVISLSGVVDEETARELGLKPFIRFILALQRKKITKLAREKSAFYKLVLMKPDAKQLHQLKSLVEAKKIKPVIDKVFPFDNAIEALLYQKSGRAKGKIIIKMK